MAKKKKKTEEEESEGIPTCPQCGNLMEEDEEDWTCPDCDSEIDFFGEEEK